MIFEFDSCVLDTSKQELVRSGEQVHAEPQVLAVLEYLARNSERVVTKIELLDEVWGDRFVSESALTSRIKLARRACGDTGREQRIVKTVHSRGYRLVAPVATRRDPLANPAPQTIAVPDEPANVAAPPTVPGRVPQRPPVSTTVFGRDRELAELDRALVDAIAGRRRSVFVTGGVGAGASTLVAEFLERQDRPELTVAAGQCIQTRGAPEPYFCLLDAFSRFARSEPAFVASTLEHVAPTWLAQMPALVDDAMSERLERRLLGSSPSRMLREGVAAVEELARVRPLVLLLGDLQWADDCTLDVVDLLLQRTEPARLMLLATSRADAPDFAGLVDTAVAAGRATSIALGPLDLPAIASLAADRAGAELPEPLVAIVARRSGGVPLFAEEIVATWVRQGLIEIGPTGLVVTVDPSTLGATIPPTLPPLIERELTTLSPDELDLLEACAVTGERFDAAAVAAALDRPVDETEVGLAALDRCSGAIGADGARAWPDGTISAAYSFTRPLTRDVVYGRIPAGRRAQMHGRVGTRLETGHRDRMGEVATLLAHHFAEAGDAVRSVGHLARAGEQANRRDAHSHAMAFCTDALARLEGVAPSPDRDEGELRVRMVLGPALVALRGWFDPSVSENYERALQLAGEASDRPEAAAARYGLATVSELHGQFERTEALLTPLLAADTEGHLALEAHELVACSTFHQGAFDRSLRTASAVLDSWDEDAYSVLMARIAEHPASSCSSWSSLASWALGRFDESLALAERAVELGEQNRYALSTAVQQRAMLHQLRDEPEACIEWSERCRAVGEDQNFPMRTIQADIYKGWALGVSGAPAVGLALISSGIERFHDAGATLNEAYYLALHAVVLLHAGDPDEADRLLAAARDRSTSRTYFFDAEIHRLQARCHLARGGAGALGAARRALDTGIGIARRQGAVTLELRATSDRLDMERAEGDPLVWRTALERLLNSVDGQAPTPDTARARSLLAM